MSRDNAVQRMGISSSLFCGGVDLVPVLLGSMEQSHFGHKRPIGPEAGRSMFALPTTSGRKGSDSARRVTGGVRPVADSREHGQKLMTIENRA